MSQTARELGSASAPQTFTRDQYLQHRHEAQRVSFRRGLPGMILLVVPMLVLLATIRRNQPPASLAEARWILVLGALVLAGTVWILVRAFLDRKLKAIHCPSCHRDNSGHMHSSMLIASGNCAFCGHAVFTANSSTSPPPPATVRPLPLKNDYHEMLKKAEDLRLRGALLGVLPFLVFVVWLACNKNYHAFIGEETWLVVALVGLGLLACAFLFIADMKARQKFPVDCPQCLASPLHPVAAEATLATGHCSKCGTSLFQNDFPQGLTPP